MDYPKFIVSNQKEESISIQRVKQFMLRQYIEYAESWIPHLP